MSETSIGTFSVSDPEFYRTLDRLTREQAAARAERHRRQYLPDFFTVPRDLLERDSEGLS